LACATDSLSRESGAIPITWGSEAAVLAAQLPQLPHEAALRRTMLCQARRAKYPPAAAIANSTIAFCQTSFMASNTLPGQGR